MRAVGAARIVATVVVLGLGVTGCGQGTAPSPASGVDGLTIPTPDPDPDDFVDAVDNPWFPLAVGASWTYRADAVGSDGDEGDDGAGAVDTVVTVTGRTEYDGVPVTLVRRAEEEADGVAPGATAVTDAYAQDTAGNVWWFGRDGRRFAEPGLFMPAEPRRGDGFRVALDGDLDVLAEVVTLQESLNTPAGSYTDVLLVEVTTTDGGLRTVDSRHYVEGVGLVAEDDEGLVAYDEALD